MPSSELDLPLPAHLPPLEPVLVSPHAFFDLIVIGSGPAALALVSRILEQRPAALYTDAEHQHLHWLKRSSASRGGIKFARTLRTKARGSQRAVSGLNGPPDDEEEPKDGDCECEGVMRILVIDRLGGWLKHWDTLFAAFEISHLRSPMWFQPAPSDLDALVAFAEKHGCVPHSAAAAPLEARGRSQRRERASPGNMRLNDGPSAASREYSLIEIGGCVGKEASKHCKKKLASSSAYARLHRDIGPAVNERDRRDYHTPSTALFRDFVQQEVVERYGLDGKWTSARGTLAPAQSDAAAEPPAITLVRGEVSKLQYGDLHVAGYERVEGFSVETACGGRAGGRAVVCALGPGGPPALPSWLRRPATQPCAGKGWAHTSALGAPSFKFPPAHVKERGGGTLLVVGGGLTSTQICDLALRKGFDKCVLIMRGHLKVKPFDVGLEWMARYSALSKMQFWQEEDAAKRLDMLRAARQGGSITPPWAARIRQLETTGSLRICTHTTVSSASWDSAQQRWSLDLVTTTDGREVYTHATPDYIIAATGAAPGFSSLPFVKDFAQRHPLPEVGGLPCLTPDLQYGQLPLFCVGGLAGLQIGPAAGNLGGMREAADRVATRLGELSLGTPSSTTPAASSHSEDVPAEEHEAASGGREWFNFSALAVEG